MTSKPPEKKRLRQGGLRRRILQPLLMFLAVVVAATAVAVTLRRRPDIEAPKRVRQAYVEGNFQQSLAQVDLQMAELARRAQTDIAPAADNLTLARRISLALVGSGLSLEEVRALMLVPEPMQIQWWTSYLLEDRRWADYFSERYARTFVGTNNGPFLLFRRRKFQMWLADQLEQGVGFDKIVRSMISAEGLWTDTPQVNFVTATIDQANNRGDPIRLAGRTSRAFLAQRIDCLQCHDDFLGNLKFATGQFGTGNNAVGGTQEHFHSLAAFYAGTGFPGAVFQGIKEDGRAYEYEFLGETGTREVVPQVPFSQELLPSQGKPRQRLADWVTHPDNRAFSRATVNRVWALMFSRPLVTPVDSIPLDDSVPPALDTLASDFSAHGFDLRRLIRMIVETQAFQRASRAEFEITEKHEESWSVFPLTQLRPEQVSGSMLQASKLTAMDASSSIFTKLQSFGEQQEFLKRFGDRGEDEFDSEAVTIAQRLVMMNGKMVSERTKVDLVSNASTRIATMVPDDGQAIELAYLAALNRRPTSTETNTLAKYIAGKRGNSRSSALGDIYWALINSTEFSWNH